MPDRIPAELAELIRLSRAIGDEPDWVQGGGGNTSVKSRDGATMFVKASGTALSDLDETHGWAELDLKAARALVATPGLAGRPAGEREKRVLELLRAAARRPAGVRPSVEASLHAELDRVVVHSHPIQLTAFLCARDSRERWRDVLADVKEPTLYVPYVDPGFTLATRLEREIATFRAANGRGPAVVLLENHGLFVAADGVDECLALHRRVTDAGRRFARYERVNPLPTSAARAPGASAGDELVTKVRGALRRGGASPSLVRLDPTLVAAEFLKDRTAVATAEQGAFTPDQIVYCRTHPVVLRGTDTKLWARDVGTYRERRRLDPKVVLVPGRGVLFAAVDAAELRVVAETWRLAMVALLASRRAGGPRLLDRAQAGFIEEWEVEHYRAALKQGGGRPLAGCVCLVLGGRIGAAASAVRALDEAGALTSVVDLGDPLAPPIAAILQRLVAEYGGLDVVVGTDGLLAQGTKLAEELLSIYRRQDSGGAFLLLNQREAELDWLSAPARELNVKVRGVAAGRDAGAAVVAALGDGSWK